MCVGNPEDKRSHALEIITWNETISNRKARWWKTEAVMVYHKVKLMQTCTDHVPAVFMTSPKPFSFFLDILWKSFETLSLKFLSAYHPPCLFWSLARFCEIFCEIHSQDSVKICLCVVCTIVAKRLNRGLFTLGIKMCFHRSDHKWTRETHYVYTWYLNSSLLSTFDRFCAEYYEGVVCETVGESLCCHSNSSGSNYEFIWTQTNIMSECTACLASKHAAQCFVHEYVRAFFEFSAQLMK